MSTAPGLVTALVLAAATGNGAYMLVYTRMFAPLRELTGSRAVPGHARQRMWAWLHALLSCPYCTETWLALAATGIYRPVLVVIPHVPAAVSYWPLGYLTSVMATGGTAMTVVLIIRKALRG